MSTQRRLRRELEQKHQNRQATITRWRTRIFLVLGLPGLYIGLLNILPKITVSPLPSLNPSDPFATPFETSNVGYVDLSHVKFLCSYKDVEEQYGSKILTPGADEGTTGGFTSDALATERIERNHKATMTCPFPFKFAGPIEKAEIRIVVSFRPGWLLWTMHHVRRFVMVKDSAGQFHWYEQPPSR